MGSVWVGGCSLPVCLTCKLAFSFEGIHSLCEIILFLVSHLRTLNLGPGVYNKDALRVPMLLLS